MAGGITPQKMNNDERFTTGPDFDTEYMNGGLEATLLELAAEARQLTEAEARRLAAHRAMPRGVFYTERDLLAKVAELTAARRGVVRERTADRAGAIAEFLGKAAAGAARDERLDQLIGDRLG